MASRCASQGVRQPLSFEDLSYHADAAGYCLRLYAERRTHDLAGVTIPSQRRYVEYFAATLQDSEQLEQQPAPRQVVIGEIRCARGCGLVCRAAD